MQLKFYGLLALLGTASASAALAASKAPARRVSQRPNIRAHPKHSGRPFPASPPRTKTCFVETHADGSDDSAFILKALNECNDGGHVVFSEGNEYTIGTALNLTFLKHIDIDIQGFIQFTNDTDYWQANSFPQVFQNATTFFQLGGEDVNIFGGGTIDGNGQIWYDLYAANPLILRPVLFGTIGLKGGTISNIKLRHSPIWYNFVANSSDVVFSGIDISGFSTSANTAKNTDGWDTYRSENIVIQDSVINNGDDCVSFKPNSTNIIVQNLHCNGSHGISVGSLGQYLGEIDIVENVYVFNISMFNASDMARLKVWPGLPSELSVDLQGGGGLGAVRNVTYDTMFIDNVDYAIEITQCYGQSNMTLCFEFPSNLTISDVVIHGMTGTTSKAHDPIVGTLVCSSPNVCSNITVYDIDVTSPKGFDEFTCTNIAEAALQVNCTS